MKTNFSILKVSVYSTFGFLSILFTSCGSYQSATPDDRDGIYGGSSQPRNEARSTSQSEQYKNYFGSLQDNNEQDQIFTDVENYKSTDYDNASERTEDYSGYASWGSNPQNVTVNVYDNSWGMGGWGWNNYWYSGYWGWNLGWGWNSWYGPAYYGWGYTPYPYYGYGYGGWYHYYPYGYGYNNYYNNGYAYYNGRRSDGYRNVINPGRGTRSANYSTRGGGRSTTYNNSGTRPRNSYYTGTRNYNYSSTPRNPQNNSTGTRNYSSTPRNNNYSTPQSSSGTRNYNNSSSTSTRNNTYSAPTRSYSSGSSGSYGGGGRSSGGGGGRSGGGGGRR